MTQAKAARAWDVDYSRSFIRFTSQHMVIAPVTGEFRSFRVAASVDEEIPEHSALQVWIDAMSVDTGNAERDAHLRSPDFLHAAKYPWITFISRFIFLKAGEEFSARGDLTIRGTTRNVALEGALLARDAHGGEIEAATTINRRDFGLQWNTPILGWLPLVGDLISIKVRVRLNALANDTRVGTAS